MEDPPVLEDIVDENGDVMQLCRNSRGHFGANDWLYDIWDNLHSFPVRDNDVFLCSYAKSGCHWMWEILRLLTVEERADHEKVDKEAYMLELNTLDFVESLSSPRILNNHSFFDEQPLAAFREKKTKVVYVYRNLKDVAVSFYYHHVGFVKYSNTFSKYLRRFVAGLVDNDNVFDYLRSWEKGIRSNPNVDILVVRFEDMKEDSLREIRKVNEFLGTNRDETFLAKVAADTDFAAMKQKKTKTTTFLDENGSPIMYRKGEVGDWKNHFTMADNEWFDHILEKEMGQSELYNFRYTL